MVPPNLKVAPRSLVVHVSEQIQNRWYLDYSIIRDPLDVDTVLYDKSHTGKMEKSLQSCLNIGNRIRKDWPSTMLKDDLTKTQFCF